MGLAAKIRPRPAGHAVRTLGFVVEYKRYRMKLGEVERTTRFEKMGHDHCPSNDIRYPVERAPGHEDSIERRRLSNRTWCGINIGLHKACPLVQIELGGQPPRYVDRLARKIQSGRLGTTLGERQGIAAKVTLKMKHAQAVNRP